jgi:hypothetical protein
MHPLWGAMAMPRGPLQTVSQSDRNAVVCRVPTLIQRSNSAARRTRAVKLRGAPSLRSKRRPRGVAHVMEAQVENFLNADTVHPFSHSDRLATSGTRRCAVTEVDFPSMRIRRGPRKVERSEFSRSFFQRGADPA